ncbi:MAG: DMT family transporter [Oscillospiraceae bacterium]|nr:DMT family transporter [Oscillospiraceae bacterium]
MLHSQGKRPVWVYYIALLFVVVFWGVSSVLYHYFYKYYSAAVLATIMTFFSSVFFWILARKKLAGIDKKFLKVTVPICLLNALGCVLQRIGLQYTTPANYAFFEHLSCVVVPVVMFILIRKKPRRIQGIAGVCCLTGCFILCGVSLSGDSMMGVGDALCISAGILLGMCVAAISVYTKDMDAIAFMAIYMTTYFVMSLLLATSLHNIRIDGVPVEQAVITWNPAMLLLVIVFGLVDIALCWLLRTDAIRHIDPVTVATMSPCSAVITGAVSVWMGIDKATPNLLIGGSIIFLSVFIPEVMEAMSSRKKVTEQ